MRMKRSGVLPLLAATFVGALGLRAEAQSTPAPMHVGDIPIDAGGEVFYALDQDFFAKAGLDVSIELMTSGAAIAAGIVSGALESGLVDLVTMASAHSHGVPLVYLAPGALYTLEVPAHQVLVRKDSPIHEPRDFAGHTLAVNGLNNIDWVSLMTWLKKGGADPAKLPTIEMPFPLMAAALDGGQVDVIVSTEPFSSMTHGRFRAVPLGNSGMADRFMVSGWAAAESWIAAHPEAARAFRTTILSTARWANQNPAISAQSLLKHTKLEADVVATMGRSVYSERLDAALVQPFIDAAANLGVIPRTFPAQEILAKLT